MKVLILKIRLITQKWIGVQLETNKWIYMPLAIILIIFRNKGLLLITLYMIFVLILWCIICFILNCIYKELIEIVKFNRIKKTLNMRTIRIDKLYKIDKISDSTEIIKKYFGHDIEKLYITLKNNNIRFFKTKTHPFFYKKLLLELEKDPNLEFKYDVNDICIIKSLKIKEEYIIPNNEKCIVTFKLIKKHKKIMERVLVFPYRAILNATTEELESLIIIRNQYKITVNIKNTS